MNKIEINPNKNFLLKISLIFCFLFTVFNTYADYHSNPSSTQQTTTENTRQLPSTYAQCIPWAGTPEEEAKCDKMRQIEENNLKREQAKEDAQKQKEKNNLLEQQRDKIKQDCDDAHERVKNESEKKSSSEKTFKEKEHEVSEQIRKTQEEISKDQTDLAKQLNDLQNNTNKEIQEIKDQLRGNLSEKIERQTEAIKDQILKLQAQLDANKLEVDTAYLNRRKAIHAQYTRCFQEAKRQVDDEKSKIKALVQNRQLSSSSLQSLAQGTQRNFRFQFQKRLNAYIHLCLNSQVTVREKQQALEQFQILLKNLSLKKKNIKRSIARLENQIQQLTNNRQLQMLKENKERLQLKAKQFNKSYELTLKSFETKRANLTNKINSLKRKQMTDATQHQRQKITTPQDRRINLLQYKCQNDLRDIEELSRTPSSDNNDADYDWDSSGATQ